MRIKNDRKTQCFVSPILWKESLLNLRNCFEKAKINLYKGLKSLMKIRSFQIMFRSTLEFTWSWKNDSIEKIEKLCFERTWINLLHLYKQFSTSLTISSPLNLHFYVSFVEYKHHIMDIFPLAYRRCHCLFYRDVLLNKYSYFPLQNSVEQ